MYIKYFKHKFDFIFSLFFLLLLSPLIISVSGILFFTNKGKVFFIQKRIGYKHKEFKIIKFKTMIDLNTKFNNILTDDQRLTRIGKIIRNYSIDEILQFINVIKGDMSIVGPRPLLPKYMLLYSPNELLRHNLKPGITGWAQINGRNMITWKKKFQYDIEYIEKVSLLFDLKIIFVSFFIIIFKKGVNSKNNLITPEYDGNN
jgi:undecaprenyl phosphate N,N'-diacetylbacillosamine 1-phosphate transferase